MKREVGFVRRIINIVCFVLSVVSAVVLSIRCKNPGEGFMRKLLLAVLAVILGALLQFFAVLFYAV